MQQQQQQYLHEESDVTRKLKKVQQLRRLLEGDGGDLRGAALRVTQERQAANAAAAKARNVALLQSITDEASNTSQHVAADAQVSLSVRAAGRAVRVSPASSSSLLSCNFAGFPPLVPAVCDLHHSIHGPCPDSPASVAGASRTAAAAVAQPVSWRREQVVLPDVWLI